MHLLLYVCMQNSKNGLHCAFNIQLHQSQITHNTRTLWNKIMSVQFGKQLNIGIGIGHLILHNRQLELTFLMLAVYCLIAIFSTVLSKPKNDFISKLASCSKHVQWGLSGWTYKPHLIVTTCHQMQNKIKRYSSPILVIERWAPYTL